MMNTIEVNEYELENHTTIQQLELDCNPGYAAILTYDNYVFFTDINWRKEYIAAVYKFATGWCECDSPIKIIVTADEIFKDSGHAIEWCFKKINK